MNFTVGCLDIKNRIAAQMRRAMVIAVFAVAGSILVAGSARAADCPCFDAASLAQLCGGTPIEIWDQTKQSPASVRIGCYGRANAGWDSYQNVGNTCFVNRSGNSTNQTQISDEQLIACLDHLFEALLAN